MVVSSSKTDEVNAGMNQTGEAIGAAAQKYIEQLMSAEQKISDLKSLVYSNESHLLDMEKSLLSSALVALNEALDALTEGLTQCEERPF